MDDGTMASTDEAMALIRAADADPRGTVLMLLRVLGSGLATATRERDEARAETADLRATVDTMQAQLDAHREWLATAQATGDEARAEVERLRASETGRREFTAAVLDSMRQIGREEEREACAVICDALGDAAEVERDACCDDRSRSLHAGRMHGADECARAIRARGAGGGM